MNDEHRYDDIIGLPHHTSATRKRMSMLDRAAQFSPFAALTGYEDAVEETARLTDERLELSEDARNRIDGQLQLISDRIAEQPAVSITYFQPDEKKSGGSYVTFSGQIRRIDEYEMALVFTDGTRLSLDTISDIIIVK